MRFFKQIDLEVSDGLKAAIDRLFVRGIARFQIQDVQESLDDNDPLRDEADALRRQHGNFWIHKDRE